MSIRQSLNTPARRRGACVIAAVALLSAAPAASARAATTAATVDAGALQASVTDNPFSIRFTDTTSGEVLRTLGGHVPDPDDPKARYGPLGFSFDLRIPVLNNAYLGYYKAGEVESIWFHATAIKRVVERSETAVRLLAATNDPAHDIELKLTRIRNGIVRVQARPVGPFADLASISGGAFATAGERFLGLGERSNAADQTGNEVFNWAEEGPFSGGDYEDFLNQNMPDFTFPSGPTATNFPIPWTLLSRGFGFLIDQSERSRFRFASERKDAWQAETETNRFRYIIFAGPTPKRVLRRYTAWTGRQPNPRPWIFGPWYQPTLETQPYQIADLWRSEDVPVTVAQTYTHYLPCGAQVGNEAAEAERIEAYHQRGYKITTYFNPHVCTTYSPVYDELAARSLFVENPAGRPYLLTNPFTADEMTSEFDFSNPDAARYFGSLLDDAIDVGYDGWMEDFGEYTPTDSRFDNGEDGLTMHNLYPVLYHRASYRHTSRRLGQNAAIFVRSGWQGSQPYSRIVWGGDPTEDWSCSDGLCAALHEALSMGLSGVAYWGTDIGGFHAVANSRTSDELNIRWLQLGSVLGVMRTQANGFSFRDDRSERSQVWHDGVIKIWRRYAKLRTQLLPYIEAASRRYQRSGLPLSRHLALAFPTDPRAVRIEDELMFGADLLVAPVLKQGARERKLYLPPGRWVEFWRSVQYREGRGVFRPDRARTVRGGRSLTVAAPLEEMPIFARAGTILPLLAADVDTLATSGHGRHDRSDHAGRVPSPRNDAIVTRAERRRELRLLVFPRGKSSTRFGQADRIKSVEGNDRWTLRIDGSERRKYYLRAALGTLRHPFVPCSLRLNGKPVAVGRWGYTADREVLRARLRLTRGRLIARAC